MDCRRRLIASPLQSLCAVLSVLLSLTGCMGAGIGKAGADLELGEPQISMSLKLDKEKYGVGAPIIATLTLTNDGELPVTIGRPSPFTVEFYLRPHTSPEPLHTQMVTWPLETVSYVALDTNETHERKLVLSRATLNEGAFDVFAVYRTEPEQDIQMTATVGSNNVPIEVSLPVSMERDTMGLIVQAEAERIAQQFFGQQHSRIDSRLVMDEKVRMYQWWVTVYYSSPTAEGETFGSCFVDPFLGRVRNTTHKQVELDTTPSFEIDSGEDKPSS